MTELPRTDWRAFMTGLHAKAYGDNAAQEERPYCVGERSFWMSAVECALQAAENATAIAYGEVAMRDARIEAMEARLQELERALKVREPRA